MAEGDRGKEDFIAEFDEHVSAALTAEPATRFAIGYGVGFAESLLTSAHGSLDGYVGLTRAAQMEFLRKLKQAEVEIGREKDPSVGVGIGLYAMCLAPVIEADMPLHRMMLARLDPLLREGGTFAPVLQPDAATPSGPTTQELLVAAHDVLGRYVAVHDDIFKGSIRKVLPIPGIFKKIDYPAHAAKLTGLASVLENVKRSANSAGLPKTFEEYVEALLLTIRHLRDMCLKMTAKIHGRGEYGSDQWRRDSDTYQALVSRYASLGAALNAEIGRR